MSKKKYSTPIVIITTLLLPVLAPVYLLGGLIAIIHITAFCGYKNAEDKWMAGLGQKTNEQILKDIITEKLRKTPTESVCDGW